MEYDKTNQGASFKNKRKTEDWHDDLTGSINVDGVDYWIDNKWYPPKEGKQGFMKHKLRLKEPKQEQYNAPAPSQDETFEDDIPW